MIKTSKNQAGFTLIEVLVAFVILAIAAGVLLESFSIGIRSIDRIERRQVALLLAQSILSAVDREAKLENSEMITDYPNEYRSTVTIKERIYDSLPNPKLQVYDIDVTVSWPEGLGKKHLSLQTRRLTPRTSL